MAKVDNYGYSSDIYYGDLTRRIIRYIARCGITEFVNTIHAHTKCNEGYKWIRDRAGATANDFEINLLNSHPNAMLIYGTITQEILEIIPLKKAR